MTETPCIRNGLQRCENLRNSLGLNYESPALTAELQAHFHIKISEIETPDAFRSGSSNSFSGDPI
jgi:hypothetical protein